MKGEANFISSGSKKVKRLRCRQYDPAIIERTISLVLGTFKALYRSFLKRCTLTNKAVGTIWWALSKPHQKRQGPDSRPPGLLVGTPSDSPSVRSPSAHFPHFSPTCFDILSWNFAHDFVLMYYRSSSTVVTLRQFLKELCLFVNLE